MTARPLTLINFSETHVKIPFLSYSTKHHLKRRVLGTDWLFIVALVATVAFVFAALRFG